MGARVMRVMDTEDVAHGPRASRPVFLLLSPALVLPGSHPHHVFILLFTLCRLASGHFLTYLHPHGYLKTLTANDDLPLLFWRQKVPRQTGVSFSLLEE